MPGKFSPLKPEERLSEAANNAGVTLDLLAPQFIAYRDAHHMQWPYFSFTCDPHNTPLGNEVSAQAIIEKLEQHQLLPPAAAVQLDGGSISPASSGFNSQIFCYLAIFI